MTKSATIDRCVKEFKLDSVKTIDGANVYLAENNGFVTRLNDKFTIEAREARTACVLPTPADLAEQFTIQNIRTVRNDYTVQLKTIVYQLPRDSMVNARAKVLMKRHLHGRIAIFAGKYELKYSVIENYVKPEVIDKVRINQVIPPKHIPDKTHPYKQQYKQEKRYHYASGTNRLQYVGQIYDR